MTRRGQVNVATIGTRQADACPVLTLPLVPRSRLPAQSSPACPCLSGCLPQTQARTPTRSRGRHPERRETSRTFDALPLSSSINPRQPINRIESTNRIAINYESNQRIESNHPINRGSQPDHRPPTPRCARTWRGWAQTLAQQERSPRQPRGIFIRPRNIHPATPTRATPSPPRPLHPKVLWAPFSALRNDRGWGHPRAAQGPHRATNTPGSTTAGANESHLRRCTHSPNPVVTTSKIGDQ